MLGLIAWLAPTVCAAQPPSPVPMYDRWKLVAQSDLILKAELRTPVEAISATLASKNYEYVTLHARIVGVLKGTPNSAEVEVKYYTMPASYTPSAQLVIGLDRKLVILFLLRVDDAPVTGWFFAGYNPMALHPADPNAEKAVRDEVANQQRIVAAYPRSKEAVPDSHHQQVLALIRKMLDERTQEAAFEKLERMGKVAVPSMIRLMDDRHHLAVRHIAFKNKFPGAFEAYAHYAPELVVDAVASLLGYITGDDFGDLDNGGPDWLRARTVDGWRVYLHYLVHHSVDLKQ
jgi:hypothetical protein